MTSLLDSASGGWQSVLYPDDKRAGDEDYFGNDDLFQPDPIANLYCREDIWYGAATFRTPWWPAGGAGFLGDMGADISCLIDKIQRNSDPWGNLPGGCNGRLAFVGITRNANGTPISNATVRCFRSSTTELCSQVTSDADGQYVATTPYADGHFLTVHSSTPSATAGATIDTLQPG